MHRDDECHLRDVAAIARALHCGAAVSRKSVSAVDAANNQMGRLKIARSEAFGSPLKASALISRLPTTLYIFVKPA